MPKQFKTYTRFDGGLNTKTNARSIKDNELADIKNAIVDEFGQIQSCGKITDNTSDYAAPSIDASVAGYGLFQGTFDYNAGGTNAATVRTFLADTDATSDTRIDIYDAGGSWAADSIDLGSTTGGAVIYDIADGAVRVCDTNFGAGNAVKWYGYISKKLWLDSSGTQLNVGGGSVQNVTGWKTDSAPPLPPFSGTAGTGIVAAVLTKEKGLVFTSAGSPSTTLTVGGTTFATTYDTQFDSGLYVAINEDGSEVQGIASRTNTTTLILESAEAWGVGADVTGYIAPDAGLGFNLEVVPTSAGSFTAATYEFAQTFIYDGNQESLPTTMTGTIAVAASKYLGCTVIASHGYADRVTGGRIYCRDSTLKGEWELLVDISLTDGCRSSLEADYNGWDVMYSQSAYLIGGAAVGVNSSDTYASLNGYSSDLSTASVGAAGEGYKTSVVTNRRKFIANVKSINANGQTELSADKLLYSEINKFDTFPVTNFIEIGINDGEDFIKLESFADRILAFKQKTLYIINVGGGSDTQWFLESEHKNMGAPFHAAVVKTDFGVAWANKQGLFFYDGSKITNLQKKILESTWKSFVNADTMVGFEPVNKHLVVMRDAAASGGTSGDAYVYSFTTNSFTFIEDLADNAIKTNIITDAYNQMTLGIGTDELESYDGEPDSGATFDITLKDDDFGLPNTVKKIYGITLEYASNASNLSAINYVYVNDSGTRQGSSTSGLSSSTVASTSADLDVNRYTFDTPLLASSFQLRLDLNGTSLQTINNIGIEYRPIYKRVT